MSVWRLFLLASLALVSIASLMDTLWGEQGLPRRKQLRQEYQLLRQRNDQRFDQIVVLRRQIDSLGSRHEVQERWIRHQLGYVKDNEIIVALSP